MFSLSLNTGTFDQKKKLMLEDVSEHFEKEK